MNIKLANRMGELAPYLFAELDRKKHLALARGMDVISLTIGDPDLPTPPQIVRAGQAAMADPKNHRYPDYAGSKAFRAAAATWMKRRFAVELDPESEVVALIGSKEGIAHLPLALVNPGEVVLCPEPGYPVYATLTRIVGGEVFDMPLVAANDFLPDLDAIPAAVARRAKALWINYPNNPTAAIAPRSFLEKVVAFARQHGCVLCVDAAYSEMAYDNHPVPSILEIPGAREVAIEFHSLSKTFNMTGWRVGFAVGNREVVGALGRLKNNLDSGVFTAVQDAGIAALELWPSHLPELLSVYQKRRDVLCDALEKAGFAPHRPRATFYVWMPVPSGDDVAFAGRLIEQAGVMVTPGSGFGPSGKGYVRFALTAPENRLAEAVERIRKVGV